MLAQFHNSISAIDPATWDALWPTRYPFTRHAFLLALENSGSVDGRGEGDSGWRCQHLTVHDGDHLCAAMPLFIKEHSYGEYVFDWSWANAYHQAGMEYYPKLVSAIPFTPATGPRLAFCNNLNETALSQAQSALLHAISERVDNDDLSGFHCLFPSEKDAPVFQGFHRRLGYQFHWFNDNYQDFDGFLQRFSSRKRKNVRKERDKVAQEQLDIRTRCARDITSAEWDTFSALYHRTYLKRSGHAGYLGQGFFHQVAQAFPDQVLLVSAHHQDHLIAAAFYMRDEHTLYGRYWGTMADIDGLHFECCYYRGIEYAIAEGLQRFDPGAQGEHKIQRGFTPVKTHSFHWLKHPAFDRAIAQFVREEERQVERYITEARKLLPFKEGTAIVAIDELTSGN